MSTTKHHLERTSGQLICDRIADRIADLLEPSSTHDTAWVLADDGSRLVPQSRIVVHPALLVQLGVAVGGSTAGASSASGYESKPAANLEPLDCLEVMRRQSSAWVRIALRRRPVGLAKNIALLAQHAHELDRDELRLLDVDVLRWWARARIVTTWDSAPMKPYVMCDECGQIGGIQVRLDPTTAVCLRCGAAWDSSTIGILGNHIQLMMSDPIPDPEPAVV